jgi:pyruvate dehydrogenase E2 component (dihydrolipoamide acetyltransferase)
MRRAVLKSVAASALVPQYSVERDVLAAPLLAALRQAREQLPLRSVVDLLHHAVATALTDHPLLNASFTGDQVVLHEQVNLAFIIEVPDGMVTPALMNASQLPLATLAQERLRLTKAAVAGSLTPDEMLSGTFTVSNLGPLGITRFTAMVLPPQSAVLAVGAPSPGGVLTLTLTCDHRVVDGAPAARFLSAVGDRLLPEQLARVVGVGADALVGGGVA